MSLAQATNQQQHQQQHHHQANAITGHQPTVPLQQGLTPAGHNGQWQGGPPSQRVEQSFGMSPGAVWKTHG